MDCNIYSGIFLHDNSNTTHHEKQELLTSGRCTRHLVLCSIYLYAQRLCTVQYGAYYTTYHSRSHPFVLDSSIMGSNPGSESLRSRHTTRLQRLTSSPLGSFLNAIRHPRQQPCFAVFLLQYYMCMSAQSAFQWKRRLRHSTIFILRHHRRYYSVSSAELLNHTCGTEETVS